MSGLNKCGTVINNVLQQPDTPVVLRRLTIQERHASYNVALDVSGLKIIARSKKNS